MKVICAQLMNVGARPSSATLSVSSFYIPCTIPTFEPPAVAHAQMRTRLVPRYLPILLHRLRYRVICMPRALLHQLLRRRIRNIRFRHQWRLLTQLRRNPTHGATCPAQIRPDGLHLVACGRSIPRRRRGLRNGLRSGKRSRRMVRAGCGRGERSRGFCCVEARGSPRRPAGVQQRGCSRTGSACVIRRHYWVSWVRG